MEQATTVAFSWELGTVVLDCIIKSSHNLVGLPNQIFSLNTTLSVIFTFGRL